jgi:formylglycine-generating enzyme required for sulfatase activity
MAVAALGTIPGTSPIPSAFHRIDHLSQPSPAEASSPIPATIFVPGGRFAVGAAWVDGRPVREAEVRPLRVGLTPVSNEAYSRFLAAGGAAEPPWWRDPDFSDPEQPVVGVTWFEAVAFCDWLHATIGGRWRLPTEAEWEHAAALDSLRPDTQPTAQRPPRLGRGAANGFGLRDVVGSVREWCRDWFTADLLQLARRYDPRGPETGERRVRRGASWRSRGQAPSWRDGFDPSDRAADGGFRVVREVP